MNEWVMVDDRLPEKGERVLVYTEYETYGNRVRLKRGITVGECDDGKWRCSNFIGNRVIAWMPLPDAPGKLGYIDS